VTDELINAMADPNDTVSENAARALVRLHNTEIIPDLMLLLDHADEGVVDRATAVLEELTYKPYGTDVKRWKLWYEENYEAERTREDLEAKDAS
jgi:HEAT repeat protein